MSLTTHERAALLHIKSLVRQLLYSNDNNMWVENEMIRIFVRKKYMKVGNFKSRRVFEIANISVDHEHRGKGIGTAVFEMIEYMVGDECFVYVDKVLSRDLYRTLKKRGYKTSTVGRPDMPCMYRLGRK